MRQHQVLLEGDAHVALAVAVGEVGDGVHLVGRAVARGVAGRLQRDVEDAVAWLPVGVDVVAREAGQAAVGRLGRLEGRRRRRKRLELRNREGCADARHLGGRNIDAGADPAPFLFDLAGEFLGAQGRDQDLDPRLVQVVAAALAVVDPHHRFEVGDQPFRRQEVADGGRQIGRAPLPAPDHHLEA